MIQTLTLRNYRPLSVNQLLDRNPYAAARAKKAEYEVIAGEAMAQGLIPQGKANACKRRVSIRCAGWPRSRFPDPSNLLKVFEDALVACGLLRDDSATWYEATIPELVRSKEWETVITLEDLP